MNDNANQDSILALDKIEFQVRIAAAVDDVWRCWADPKLLKQWWGDKVHLDLKVGGGFEEQWINSDGEEIVTSGLVIICQDRRSFTLTWADPDWKATTEVMIVLRQADDVTELTLRHRGWIAFYGEKGDTLRAQHTEGWERHLDSLVAFVESARFGQT